MAPSADAAVRPTPRFEALVLDYLAHLEFERGLSRNTLSAYRTDLLQFGRFLAERGKDATDASGPDLSDFLAELATGDGNGTPPVLDGDRPPQGGLSAVLLPPPAARGSDRRRPGRQAADAAARQEASRGAELLRGPEAARAAARGRPDRHARPRAAGADVRVGAARLGDDRARDLRHRHRVRGPARARQGLEGAPGPGRRQGARGGPDVPALRAPRARRRLATSASCSSTSAAAR